MRCGGYHDHAFHGVVAHAVCRLASAPCAARDVSFERDAPPLRSLYFPFAGCTLCGGAARFTVYPLLPTPAARLTCDSLRRSPRASWSSHSTWTGRDPPRQHLFFAVSRQSLSCKRDTGFGLRC
jgi:hypothetical protein